MRTVRGQTGGLIEGFTGLEPSSDPGASAWGAAPKVPMPGEKAGPVEWREYYPDQFKVLRDKVPPPSAEAPLEQMVAYQDAKHSYDKKKVIGMIATGCALSVALVTFISTMSQL